MSLTPTTKPDPSADLSEWLERLTPGPIALRFRPPLPSPVPEESSALEQLSELSGPWLQSDSPVHDGSTCCQAGVELRGQCLSWPSLEPAGSESSGRRVPAAALLGADSAGLGRVGQNVFDLPPARRWLLLGSVLSILGLLGMFGWHVSGEAEEAVAMAAEPPGKEMEPPGNETARPGQETVAHSLQAEPSGQQERQLALPAAPPASAALEDDLADAPPAAALEGASPTPAGLVVLPNDALPVVAALPVTTVEALPSGRDAIGAGAASETGSKAQRRSRARRSEARAGRRARRGRGQRSSSGASRAH